MERKVIPFLSIDIVLNPTKLVVGRELLSPTKTQVGPGLYHGFFTLFLLVASMSGRQSCKHICLNQLKDPGMEDLSCTST